MSDFGFPWTEQSNPKSNMPFFALMMARGRIAFGAMNGKFDGKCLKNRDKKYPREL